MKFVIRADDIGWTPRPAAEPPLKEPDSGLELARRFHEAMGGLPWLAGVIPSTLDSDGKKWLASAPAGVTVAMHGVTHRRVGGVDSEFRGMSYERCRVNLLEGLVELGVKTTHFIPPFNAIEPDLPEALFDCGFRTVWGQYESIPRRPRPLESLTFVPSLYELYSATLASMGHGQLPILDRLPFMLKQDGYAVITLHITWEAARGGGTDFEGVRELVGMVRNHVVTPDQYLVLAG